MTSTLDKPAVPTAQLWSSMPGWGIVVNLLPAEVVAARRVRVIRKMILSAVVVIALVAALAYGYAFWQVHSASSQLSAAQVQTTQLQSEQLKYSPVVTLEGEISHVQEELAGLTAANVDLPRLVGKVVSLSPQPSLVTKVDVEVTAAAPPTSTSVAGDATGSLDSSGQYHIGTITVGGTARTVKEISAYVRRLAQLPGMVEVFPVTAQNTNGALEYAIEMTMTDKLLSGGATALATLQSGGI